VEKNFQSMLDLVVFLKENVESGCLQKKTTEDAEPMDVFGNGYPVSRLRN